MGQIGQSGGLRRQEGIAHVFARQEGRQGQAGRQHGRHVLGGMHRDIDPAVDQRLLDFLSEKPLAADFRQWPVLDPVAGCLDDNDLEGLFGQAMGRHQPVAGFMGLCQRQLAASRADTQRI